MNRIQKWTAVSIAALILLAGVAMVAPSAYAHGGGEELLSTLDISAEEFEAAKEEARVAAINEAAAEGWISAEEAETLIEYGRGLRLGRGPYYEGVIDKDAHLSAALGISTAELDEAKDAAYEARLEQAVADDRITAEEAEDILAIHEFKESLDKDALLVQALGITVGELNQARDDNVSYDDLLNELGLSTEEAKASQEAAYEAAVQQAVDQGSLTEAQAEDAVERGGCHGGGRGGRRGPRPRGGNGDNEAPQNQASFNA